MRSEPRAVELQGGQGLPPGGYAPPGAMGPPPGGYAPPGGAAPPGFGAPPGPYGPPPQTPPFAELKKQATTWLIVALVSFFFCGGINCLGVIGAVLAFLAMQAVDQGNLADAEYKLKWSKILTIVGAALGLVSVILGILYYFTVVAVNLIP